MTRKVSGGEETLPAATLVVCLVALVSLLVILTAAVTLLP